MVYVMELFLMPRIEFLIVMARKCLCPPTVSDSKAFLDAPDYTVTDEDIIKFIWKGQSNVQINTFCSAGNKLGKRLEQAGCGVCFRRFGSDRYRMLFIDDLVGNDLT